jgi:ATP synthase protein I
MSDEQSPLSGHRYRVVRNQAVIGFLAAAGFLLQGPWQALAALYGALIAIILAYLLGRRIGRANQTVIQSPRWTMALIFIGVVQRFLLVLVLFGVGFSLLKLPPLATIVGFGLTQLGYLIGARGSEDKR